MPQHREIAELIRADAFRLLRWNQSVAAVEVVHSPGAVTPLAGQGHHWHFHPAAELTYIAKGEGTRLVADHIGPFESGDLVMIGSNVPHYWHMRGSSTGIAIMWDFALSHGIWHFGEAMPLRALLEHSRRGLHIRGRTAEATRARMEHLARRTGLDRLAGFFEIMAGLLTAPRAELEPLSAKPFSLSGSAETQATIQRAVSYILAGYRDDIKLIDLLKITRMSRATFARQFRFYVGKSFSSFRNQVRLQAACRALRETDEPVGTIALNEGFNQLSFFNRLFRRELGISPSGYRIRARESIAEPTHGGHA